MLHDFWNALRYAIRSLRRTPGFAAAAIATIALGVGVNTGIYSVINGVLFRDLPVPDAHELVSIGQRIEGVSNREGAPALGLFSTAEYEAYRDRTETLAGLAGFAEPIMGVLGGGAQQQTPGLLVTCNYFDVMEQRPTVGRALREQDCAAGADPVVVLGHDLWTSAFAADPAIVGRTVELNRQLFTVVGIAAERTYGGRFTMGFFAPISTQPLFAPNERSFDNARASWLHLVGRRGDGASLEQVRAELGLIAAQIDLEEPGRVTTLTVERAKPEFLPPFIRDAAVAAAAVIMAAFGLLLLLVCANVANLLIARGIGRSRELAVRLSLGASRGHVARQLLTESMLLAIGGGVLGSLLAVWSFQALLAVAMPAMLPVGLPALAIDASPDFRVLSVALALTLVTGVLFGLAPALRASKTDLSSMIKQDSAGGTGSGGGRLEAALVGVQVALCMVLIVGAGLLLRGLHAAQTIDPGFDSSGVIVLSYDYVDEGERSDDPAFWQRLKSEILALPGVDAAAYVWREPLGDDFALGGLRLPGWGEEAIQTTEVNAVEPAYFSIVGLRMTAGRAFTDAELADEPRVAIVSESTARNLWGTEDPLGQTLLWRGARDEETELRVVGVVADAQVAALGRIDPYYVYIPTQGGEKLLIKSRMDFASTATAVRNVVRALDPGLPAPLYPLDANLERWRGISGVVTTLAGSLGGLALVLAAVGIYGVVSHFVGRRLREIGVRLALGARAANVYRFIFRRTMIPVAIGAAIGAAAAFSASGVLSGALFGVSPLDPLGLGGAALFVLGVAAAAGGLAARAATRVDPAETLRHE